jgi:hypothetical protein
VADDEVDHRIHEAVELRFGDRFHALRGHADGQAGDGGFVQRRVEDAFGAEGRGQPGRGAEHAAVDAHVLAQHDHARVIAQLVGQRLGDRLDQCNRLLAHARFSNAMACSRCASTSAGMSP